MSLFKNKKIKFYFFLSRPWRDFTGAGAIAPLKNESLNTMATGDVKKVYTSTMSIEHKGTHLIYTTQ
jgi:hypothetical protein